MPRAILILASLVFSSAAVRAEGTPPPAEAPAVKPTLTTGSDAPALKPEKWLKGEAVTTFDPKKVYIIECWATWCGPCVAAIPHMNALHAKFKDKGLVVIGMNVMDGTEEKASAFVTRQGDKMAYRVAYDGKPGQIAKDWLEAANVRGIPHSFVVRDGKILWQGHPLDLTEVNVQNILNGRTIAVIPPAEQAKLNEAVVTYRKARLEVLGLLQTKQADAALAKIAEKENILVGTDPADPDLLRAMAWSIKGERETSLAYYQKALKAGNGNAAVLFRVAYGLMDYGSVRDTALALECAREAAKKDANPIVFHLQARAELAAGNKDAAMAILEKIAVEQDSDEYREELRVFKENGTIPAR